jgi:hypothetical protein
MKLLVACLILIAALPVLSSAMWGYISLEELVQDSDLILVGTLGGVAEFSRDGTDYGEGVITVEEVIWGNVSPGDTLTLKWQNPHELVCPRVEHRHNQNVKAIWLLTVEAGHDVRANYPGRFVELADRRKVERILRRKNVCLRAAKYAVSQDEPADVSLVFRNPTQTPLLFPGIQPRDGGLYIGAGVGLAMSYGWGDHETKVNPVAGSIGVSDDLAPITVPPGQEYRVTLNIRELFDLAPGQVYSLRFEVAGYDPANNTRLYVTEPKPAKKEARSGTQRPAGVSHGAGIGLVLCCFAGIVALVKRNRTRRARF